MSIYKGSQFIAGTPDLSEYAKTSEVTSSINSINNTLYSKANADLSNISSNIDYVVEYKVYADGSWYRKYKSCWLEQGGRITMNDSTNSTVDFPKEFANTNYTWNIHGIRTSGQDVYAWQCGIYENYTTSSMQIRNSSNGTMVICWEVKGQGAEKE